MATITITIPESVVIQKNGADYTLTAKDLIDGYARRGQAWSEGREVPVNKFEEVLIANWDGRDRPHETYMAKEGAVQNPQGDIQIIVGTWKPNALEYARLRLEVALRSEALEGVLLKWQIAEQAQRQQDQQDSLLAFGAVGKVEISSE